ncbi:hypothetical protein ACHAWO_013708 [Cyclotella atomus]|uniref:Uncharacterized protein n=1 Tax=Cyclotella atomus TaxID=382360 RepID=A0ABD3PHH5_9STRA
MLIVDPFVIRVKIVCGKGSHVLCEEVERWIKREKNVSNAPKTKYEIKMEHGVRE